MISRKQDQGLSYLCGCDPDRIRLEAGRFDLKIESERQHEFIGGVTEPQFLVTAGDRRFWLVPTGKAARDRQAAYGRYLPPYSTVPA